MTSVPSGMALCDLGMFTPVPLSRRDFFMSLMPCSLQSLCSMITPTSTPNLRAIDSGVSPERSVVYTPPVAASGGSGTSTERPTPTSAPLRSPGGPSALCVVVLGGAGFGSFCQSGCLAAPNCCSSQMACGVSSSLPDFSSYIKRALRTRDSPTYTPCTARASHLVRCAFGINPHALHPKTRMVLRSGL